MISVTWIRHGYEELFVKQFDKLAIACAFVISNAGVENWISYTISWRNLE